MKKTLLTTALAAALSFSGLAAAAEKLVVAATPVPHAEILELIKPTLAKEGVDLQIKVFTVLLDNLNYALIESRKRENIELTDVI